ncbi:MAG TPA: class I SAM-dependent methyltransferase [Blastocatellia bacterium]|nr:class I SAM-dependent methyltransferase [Blastocatellia bacterium]
MDILSEKQHWDLVHQQHQAPTASPAAGLGGERKSWRRRCTAWLKRRLGERGVRWILQSHHDHIYWNTIVKKYFPDLRGARFLEVGSAPGELLVKHHQALGCVPFGIDYSEPGVEANRQVFRAQGLNPDNVFCADFFGEAFQAQHRESFDVVFSAGFIEHFTDARRVVDHHLNLLKPGGYLVIGIPNLRGVNYWLLRAFYKELLDIHNLDIMRRSAFAQLFDASKVERRFCDYYGTLSLDIVAARDDSPLRSVLAAMKKLGIIGNLCLRLLLRNRTLDTPLTSPFLMFVGKKK